MATSLSVPGKESPARYLRSRLSETPHFIENPEIDCPLIVKLSRWEKPLFTELASWAVKDRALDINGNPCLRPKATVERRILLDYYVPRPELVVRPPR